MEYKGREVDGVGWVVDADHRVREVGYVVGRNDGQPPVFETWDGETRGRERKVYKDLVDAEQAAQQRIEQEIIVLNVKGLRHAVRGQIPTVGEDGENGLLVEEKDAKDVLVTTSGCAGLCSREPMMTVELKGTPPVKYADLDEDRTQKIFSDHVMSGRVVEEYALAIGSERVG